jgi:hypothetical protein
MSKLKVFLLVMCMPGWIIGMLLMIIFVFERFGISRFWQGLFGLATVFLTAEIMRRLSRK